MSMDGTTPEAAHSAAPHRSTAPGRALALALSLLAGALATPGWSATAPIEGEPLCGLVPSLMEPEPLEVCPLPPLPASMLDKMPAAEPSSDDEPGRVAAALAPEWSWRPVPRPRTRLASAAGPAARSSARTGSTIATSTSTSTSTGTGTGTGTGSGGEVPGGSGGGGGGTPSAAGQTPPAFALPPVIVGREPTTGPEASAPPVEPPAPVPVPAAGLLLVGALGGLGALRRARR